MKKSDLTLRRWRFTEVVVPARKNSINHASYAKADAQTTLPAKVPANIKDIELLRGAYHRL